MFGQKTPFGTTSSTTSAFGTAGTTSLFGQQNKPAISFGSPQTTTAASGGLFGSKPLFGSPSNTAATGTTSLFGQPSAGTTNMFGQTSQQPKSLFGASTATPAFGTTSTSLFGSSQPAQSTSIFGSSGFSATPTNGTTIPFDPALATDTMMRNNISQQINTKHQCITAMKQYENKCMEELRVEDYMAGRKGGGGMAVTGGLTLGQPAAQPVGTGLFGSTSSSMSTTSAPGSSLFGQQQTKSLFGSGLTSSFGNTATTTTGTSLFGQSTSNTGSNLFGAKPQTPGTSLFGQPAAQSNTFGAASTGLFGSKPATGGLFSTPASQQTTSLFGGQQQSAFGVAATSAPSTFGFATPSTATSLFGTTPAANSTGLFGATTTTTPSLFAPKPAAPLFGNATSQGFPATNVFGQQQTQTNSLFGPNKPAQNSLFGAQTPANMGTGLFGTSTAAPGGLFAQQKPANSLFGTSPNTGGFFGAPATQQPTQMFGGAMTTNQSQPTISLLTDPNYSQVQQEILKAQLATSPYGDSPILRMITKAAACDKDTITGSAANNSTSPNSLERQRRFLQSKAAAMSSVAPAIAALPPYPSIGNTSNLQTSLIFSPRRLLGGSSISNSPLNLNRSIGSAPLRRTQTATNSSILSSRAGSNNSSLGPLFGPGDGDDEDASYLLRASESSFQRRRGADVKRLDMDVVRESMQRRNVNPRQIGHQPLGQIETGNNTPPPILRSFAEATSGHRSVLSPPDNRVIDEDDRDDLRESSLPRLNLDTSHEASLRSSPRHNFSNNQDEFSSTTHSQQNIDAVSSRSIGRESIVPPHPARISLAREEYYTEPSLADMELLTDGETGECRLDNGLTVGRLGYGSVYWPGPLVISQLDLDDIVHFRYREVTVYPRAEDKPPVGTGLNRRAEISLERVWPTDRSTREPIKDPQRLERMRYREKLERASAEMEATFKDYRPETGTWVFVVEHFTKYGLPAEDDLEEDKDCPSPAQYLAAKMDKQKQTTIQRAKIPHQEIAGLSVSGSPIGLGGRRRSANDTNPISQPMTIDSYDNSIEEIDSRIADAEDCAKYLIRQRGAAVLDFDDDVLDMDEETKFQWLKDPIIPEKKAKRGTETMLEDLYNDSRSMLIDSPSAIIHFTPQDTRPQIFSLPPSRLPERQFSSLISLSDSVTNGRSHSIRDGGLFHGRRSRIGWANGSILVHSMLPESNSIQLSVIRTKQPLNIVYVNELFDHHVRLSHIISADGGNLTICPRIRPGNNAAQLIDSLIGTSQKYERFDHLDVWKLCKALWTDPIHQNKTSAYESSLERRNCVSDWLREMTKEIRSSSSNTKARKTALKGRELVEHEILMEVLAGQLESAVDLAMDSHPHLALLLASVGSTEMRQMAGMQLTHWRSTGADVFISRPLMKIYALLAGEWKWTKKVPGKRDEERLVCWESEDGDGEEMDWRQILGIFLWYITNSNQPISEAVSQFEEAIGNDRRNKMESDLHFQLIKLACERAHDLAAVLEPAMGDRLDYQMSWHLWSILNSIGYTHLPQSTQQILHRRFGEQLMQQRFEDGEEENDDDYKRLAVFAAMHCEDASCRSSMVQEFLDRIALTSTNRPEEWQKIQEQFKISPEWTARARWLAAKRDGDQVAQLTWALAGGQLAEAHSLFTDFVAPMAINEGNTRMLDKFSGQMDAVSDRIAGWATGGKLFVDFNELKKCMAEADDFPLEDLIQRAESLRNRLDGLQIRRNNPIGALAIAEMGVFVFDLLRAATGHEAFELPMSDDHRMRLLRRAARELVNEGVNLVAERA